MNLLFDSYIYALFSTVSAAVRVFLLFYEQQKRKFDSFSIGAGIIDTTY